MAVGRPTKPLNVTAEEKEKLTMLARRPKTGQALAMRARIVLGCSDGLSNGEVPSGFASRGPRSASGANDSVSAAWKGCSMSHGRGRRDPSPTRRSRK